MRFFFKRYFNFFLIFSPPVHNVRFKIKKKYKENWFWWSKFYINFVSFLFTKNQKKKVLCEWRKINFFLFLEISYDEIFKIFPQGWIKYGEKKWRKELSIYRFLFELFLDKIDSQRTISSMIPVNIDKNHPNLSLIDVIMPYIYIFIFINTCQLRCKIFLAPKLNMQFSLKGIKKLR